MSQPVQRKIRRTNTYIGWNIGVNLQFVQTGFEWKDLTAVVRLSLHHIVNNGGPHYHPFPDLT